RRTISTLFPYTTLFRSNFLEGAKEDLPWIFSKNSLITNEGQSLHVPELNAEIEVIFPFREIGAGFYTGYWLNKKNSIAGAVHARSEEHTSELQSRENIV